MPTTAAAAAFLLPRALLLPWPRPPPAPFPSILPAADRRRLLQSPCPRFWRPRPRPLSLVAASSVPSFDELDSNGRSPEFKKSILLNLVQEIEPLDVNRIQKDVPANTVDVMKRTISGMLGLLPSDQFHVRVEALWEPLFKLLISSMKTGYTLCNAEYRLCLERNLDIHEEYTQKGKTETEEEDRPETFAYRFPTISDSLGKNDVYCNQEKSGKVLSENMEICNIQKLTPEVQEYIFDLQSRLRSIEKELHDIKKKNSIRQMQQFVGEEKNDLLDYLRSLPAEKVAELSESTCPGVEETIHSVVHGLLATLSPKIQSKPPPSGDPTGGSQGIEQDKVIGNTFIRFQPLVSLPRDYLARLLFWCMLLGHYIRGLEYRLELMELVAAASAVDAGW